MSHRLLVDIFRSLNSEGLPSEDVSVQHPSATRPILHGSKIDRVTRPTAQLNSTETNRCIVKNATNSKTFNAPN